MSKEAGFPSRKSGWKTSPRRRWPLEQDASYWKQPMICASPSQILRQQIVSGIYLAYMHRVKELKL